MSIVIINVLSLGMYFVISKFSMQVDYCNFHQYFRALWLDPEDTDLLVLNLSVISSGPISSWKMCGRKLKI